MTYSIGEGITHSYVGLAGISVGWLNDIAGDTQPIGDVVRCTTGDNELQVIVVGDSQRIGDVERCAYGDNMYGDNGLDEM